MTRYADIDFIGLIEREAGISLTRKSNHGKFGDEFVGPCPFCKGGQDRLLVWPQGSRPHYYCRVCNREGSPAQFLMEYADISFGEALELLGLPDSDEQHEYTPPTLNEQLARGAPPSKKWQEAALILIERAEKYLWHPKSPEGQQALAYLRARGLHDETIRRARLGCVPLGADGRWYVGEIERWGVNPDELREDLRAKGGVRVPNGILIPWMEGKTVWKLCVKRPGEVMSYGQVMGSSDGGLYNIDSVTADQSAMMVESELCALSVQQEAGDIINCIATGSTPKGRNSRSASDLVAASFILQSFDADAAGDEAAEYWIQRFKDKCLRWRPWADEWSEKPRFKDPNEMLQHQEAFKQFTGYTLRGWVEQGIWAAQLPPPEGPDGPNTPDRHNKSSSPDVPPSESNERAEFDGVVSPVMDVFESVPATKRQTIEERAEELRSELREPYEPATLSALPRKQCPHGVLHINQDKSGRVAFAQSTPCKGVPIKEHGWCEEHALSHDFLCLMAGLGYPEIELTFQAGYQDGKPVMGARIIGSGVANSEAYAECAPRKWLARDIPRIKAKFSSLKLVS